MFPIGETSEKDFSMACHAMGLESAEFIRKSLTNWKDRPEPLRVVPMFHDQILRDGWELETAWQRFCRTRKGRGWHEWARYKVGMDCCCVFNHCRQRMEKVHPGMIPAPAFWRPSLERLKGL